MRYICIDDMEALMSEAGVQLHIPALDTYFWH